jgi:hypothetical protein
MWLSRVVLPLPKNPVIMVTGSPSLGASIVVAIDIVSKKVKTVVFLIMPDFWSGNNLQTSNKPTETSKPNARIEKD